MIVKSDAKKRDLLAFGQKTIGKIDVFAAANGVCKRQMDCSRVWLLPGSAFFKRLLMKESRPYVALYGFPERRKTRILRDYARV
jgi:hypothetical protein